MIKNVVLLFLGVVFLFCTESVNGATNIIGLCLVAYECNKLNLFSYGRSDKHTIVAKEQ